MHTRFRSALDRTAIILMAVLLALTIILLAIGDQSAPYVREFSWKDRPVGAEDTAFALRFSRSMNQSQVEAQLMLKTQGNSPLQPISQLLPGKVSWSGKKMLYTVNAPLPYGTNYEIALQGVTATNNKGQSIGRAMTPFSQKFATRARMFGYIGTQGENRGRLMLRRFGQNSAATAVTPLEYLVKDFRFTPEGAGIVFSAVPANSAKTILANQQIYRSSFKDAIPTLVLDSKEYQNIKFDLSSDGKILVVQRVGIQNPSDFGIWAIDLATGQVIQRISQGGSFIITPDSAAIAVSEGQGVAIKPLISGADVADFMPEFGRVINFAPNGSAALLEKYNSDYSRDLFLVTNQGVEKKLLSVQGEIQTAQFTADGQGVYSIVAELNTSGGEPEAGKLAQYGGQPYLMGIDIPTAKVFKLLKLPQQQGITMSLAPDGRALLFDQLVTSQQATNNKRLAAPDGQSIEQGKIWMLSLPKSLSNPGEKIEPQEVSVGGYNPRWAP
jgi:Bacterial Ig-like domain